MRNQDLIPPPYVLANNTNGNISIAGIPLGTNIADTDQDSTIVIKTNGGTIITMPAYNAETSKPDE